MKKEKFIKRRGKATYEKLKQQSREWNAAHPEQTKARDRVWREAHPEQVKANDQERCRKGGKYYEKTRAYNMQGLRHDKNLIRGKHHRKWDPYKKLIAPDSVLHHEWLPGTADFRGVALVEADPHQYGYIDVIQILDGEITLLTEEEVKNGKTK